MSRPTFGRLFSRFLFSVFHAEVAKPFAKWHRPRCHSIVLFLFLGLASVSWSASFTVNSDAGNTLSVSALAEFDRPWAMTFLPSGSLLVTEKPGRVWLLDMSENGQYTRIEVQGVPEVTERGQGGLGDIVAHPDFVDNQWVYLSFVERERRLSGAVVIRGRLDQSQPQQPRLVDQEIIWRQMPKVRGEGHYGHRLAFSSQRYLFITSGERQMFDPAQDMSGNLGKIVRLHDDGRIPKDNPWFETGSIAREFWTLGHRNPLGIAFDKQGALWVHEMGPRGGDELNRIVAKQNYGYPIVSNGRHYSGLPIPDHDTRPEFMAPAISWSPAISPSGLVIYEGGRYPDWEGSALIGGLSSRSLVRVGLEDPVMELERFDMKQRIREVELDADGVVFLLEDGVSGRLLRLMPH